MSDDPTTTAPLDPRMIDLPRYDQAAHIREEIRDLVEFVEECHAAATEKPELAERLLAVADEQERRIATIGAHLKSMVHVYGDRRAPK